MTKATPDRTVTVSYDSHRSMHVVTTSRDGHRITSVPVFESAHQDAAYKIRDAFLDFGGYNLLSIH